MAPRVIWPLQVWQSGTNENSLPANDNALTVQVVSDGAIGFSDSEPVFPEEDDQYIIGTSWGGFVSNNLVIYKGGTWLEFESFEGWLKSVEDSVYFFDGAAWVLVSSGGASSRSYSIVNEVSAFTATVGVHDGLDTYTRAGGDATFSSSQTYTAGMTFPLRATAGISLVESGVTLTPPAGGSLDLEEDMSVQVVMTSATTGDVIGQTVPA